MLLGALWVLNVSFASFRLSRGCKLELTLATMPTSSNVAEERASAWSNGAPVVAFTESDTGTLSATASERDEEDSAGWPVPPGYASAAKRYGRGMRSAVRASGSSSHDLHSVSEFLSGYIKDYSYDDIGDEGAGECTCGGASSIGDTGEKPYLPITGVFLGDERPISDSLFLPLDLPMLPLENGFSVYVESFEPDLSCPWLCS